MMSADVTLFRSLALSFPKAVENAHCNHPDFRLHNRIFATLSKEAGGYGVLMLTPGATVRFPFRPAGGL